MACRETRRGAAHLDPLELLVPGGVERLAHGGGVAVLVVQRELDVGVAQPVVVHRRQRGRLLERHQHRTLRARMDVFSFSPCCQPESLSSLLCAYLWRSRLPALQPVSWHEGGRQVHQSSCNMQKVIAEEQTDALVLNGVHAGAGAGQGTV